MAQRREGVEERASAFFNAIFGFLGRDVVGRGAEYRRRQVDPVHVTYGRFPSRAAAASSVCVGDSVGARRVGDHAFAYSRVHLASNYSRSLARGYAYRAQEAPAAGYSPGVATGDGLPPQELIERYRLTHRTIIDASPPIRYPFGPQQDGQYEAEPNYHEVEVAHPAAITVEVIYLREYSDHAAAPPYARFNRCRILEAVPADGLYRTLPVLASEARERNPTVRLADHASRFCACCYRRVLIARQTSIDELPEQEDVEYRVHVLSRRLRQFLPGPVGWDGIAPRLSSLSAHNSSYPFNDPFTDWEPEPGPLQVVIATPWSPASGSEEPPAESGSDASVGS